MVSDMKSDFMLIECSCSLKAKGSPGVGITETTVHAERCTFAGPKDHGLRVLLAEADRETVELAMDWYASGKAAWVWDPEVPNVVALVRTDDRSVALCVVYIADGDFETSFEFDTL